MLLLKIPSEILALNPFHDRHFACEPSVPNGQLEQSLEPRDEDMRRMETPQQHNRHYNQNMQSPTDSQRMMPPPPPPAFGQTRTQFRPNQVLSTPRKEQHPQPQFRPPASIRPSFDPGTGLAIRSAQSTSGQQTAMQPPSSSSRIQSFRPASTVHSMAMQPNRPQNDASMPYNGRSSVLGSRPNNQQDQRAASVVPTISNRPASGNRQPFRLQRTGFDGR